MISFFALLEYLFLVLDIPIVKLATHRMATKIIFDRRYRIAHNRNIYIGWQFQESSPQIDETQIVSFAWIFKRNFSRNFMVKNPSLFLYICRFKIDSFFNSKNSNFFSFKVNISLSMSDIRVALCPDLYFIELDLDFYNIRW